MMKKHKYTEVSHRRCANCDRPMKKNLLEKKPNATLCFKCTQEMAQGTGNPIVTASQARTGKIRGRAGGLYGPPKIDPRTRAL